MSSDVVIRQATSHDRAALLPLHRSLYLDHRETVLADNELLATQYRDFESVLEEDLRSLLSREDALVFAAEIDGQLVGYITGCIQDDGRRVIRRRGVVEDWLVTDDQRATGLGRRLMEVLMTAFRERGCQLAESSTWVKNDKARQAHIALGFQESQVRFRRWLRDA